MKSYVNQGIGFILFVMCCVLLWMSAGETEQTSLAMSDWQQEIQLIESITNLGLAQELNELKGHILVKGFLPPEAAKEMGQHLTEKGYRLTTQSNARHGIKEWEWTREREGLKQQLKYFVYPHEFQAATNIIYTVELNEGTLKQHQNTMHFLLQDVAAGLLEIKQGQLFVTITGSVSVDQQPLGINLARMVTDELEGDIKSKIEDHHYKSMTGYVNSWGGRSIPLKDHRFNIQLSSRTNQLDEVHQVAIGYPLILIEH
jgi:hypothetical protein